MNGQKLSRVFKSIKKLASLDYAIVRPDTLGDCNTCVNHALCEEYGELSKGIWIKHWTSGMNAERPIKYQDRLWVAHDITEKQFEQIKAILEYHQYNVEPQKYDPYKCIEISEKSA